MDTSDTRVTRAQAAALVGVNVRTISRWSAAGLITPQRGGWRDPATYDRKEVDRVARERRAGLYAPAPEADISA